MKKISSNTKLILITVLCSILITAIFLTGLLDRVELNLSDFFFQSEVPLDGNIAIIEIDAKSLDALGPFNTWPRNYMASMIENLNSDPNVRPAVIGIDIMYFGNSTEEADNALVEACAKTDNVVIGSLVNFDSALLTEDNGNFYMGNVISQIEEPYEELKNVTRQGHVNTKIDEDGVVRRSLHYIDLPDKRRINSFAYEIYKMFANKMDLTENPDIPEVEWYIPYSAKPTGYSDSFSFVDILEGKVNPDVFEDRIVLIGPYASGLLDEYITSIDHNSKMYGVEIHANVIDTLIKGNFKTEVSKEIQVVLLGVFVILAIIIFNRYKLRYSTFILILFTIGYWAIICLMYHFLGLIFDVLYIPLFVIIIYIASIAVKYIKTALEKRRVENTFKKYVAPQVVDEIFNVGMDKIELGGKKTDIACLFVDIRGFTTMSEALNPEQVVEILNEYLSLTSRCIFNNNGTLDKFIGDATMAIFNAPMQQEDYVFKAVKTAWDIKNGSAYLEKKLKEKFGKSISFGIGVNCGPAVVGNIGADMRMDYTAIGDTVNTAARLESNAKSGQILISKAVYDIVKYRIIATSIGEIPLKGKSNGIEVFLLEGIKD